MRKLSLKFSSASLLACPRGWLIVGNEGEVFRRWSLALDLVLSCRSEVSGNEDSPDDEPRNEVAVFRKIKADPQQENFCRAELVFEHPSNKAHRSFLAIGMEWGDETGPLVSPCRTMGGDGGGKPVGSLTNAATALNLDLGHGINDVIVAGHVSALADHG